MGFHVGAMSFYTCTAYNGEMKGPIQYEQPRKIYEEGHSREASMDVSYEVPRWRRVLLSEKYLLVMSIRHCSGLNSHSTSKHASTMRSHVGAV